MMSDMSIISPEDICVKAYRVKYMGASRSRSKITVKIAVAAVMAALVFWGSQMQIQIPSVVGFSRFHLGNIMCALSGLLLGPWWGGLAAGMGSALFDMMNPAYIAEAPITFLTKGLYGVVAGVVFVYLFKRKRGYAAEAVSAVCAALSYIVIYLVKNFFYNNMLLAGMSAPAAWLAMAEKVPSALFNGLVAVIFAPILGVALNKALRAAGLDRILT